MKIQIIRECSDFLKASNGVPLVRMLPMDGPTVRDVKIRKKKSTTPVDEAFNTVFSDHPNLRQRCVFANGSHAKSDNPLLEEYYVFPKNGFKFMYSTSVTNSGQQYGEVLANLNTVMSPEAAASTITDVLTYDYKTEDLYSGLVCGCEIIVFGSSSYIALSRESVKSYSTLFSL